MRNASPQTQTPVAVVIGSGIGGLATAIRLSLLGFSVHVFEKNNAAGGKLGVFEERGFVFDTGPSLFTQPENIEELFALAGEPIEDYFKYQKVPVACNYFFANGKTATGYANKNKLAASLEAQLGEPAENTLRYLNDAENLYEHVGKIFLDYSLHKPGTWLHKRIVKALATSRPKHIFRSLHAHNAHEFVTPEVTQMFDRYATYNGSDPFKAPAMLSIIPHLEYTGGTYYPAGGMISIAQALHRLAIKKGVQFHFNTAVEKIVHQNGKVEGVIAAGKMCKADVVVSDLDVFYTYRDLLKWPAKAAAVLKQERSSSALIFYWGMNRQFPQLDLHNIFFTADYRKEFASIFDTQTLYDDPTVYINITQKYDAGHAPAGAENWFVMVNVPAKTDADWELLKQEARKHIITKLNRMLFVNIEEYIVNERTLTPQDIQQQTGSYLGSLYGTSSNSLFAAFARHPNFSSQIKGLYFCGGSVHPGGGIPLCFKSAAIVANLISSAR